MGARHKRDAVLKIGTARKDLGLQLALKVSGHSSRAPLVRPRCPAEHVIIDVGCTEEREAEVLRDDLRKLHLQAHPERN